MTECKKEFYITNNIISNNQIFLSYDFKKTKSSNDTRFNCICVRSQNYIRSLVCFYKFLLYTVIKMKINGKVF